MKRTMDKSVFRIVVFSLLLFAAAGRNPAPAEGWTSLFDGQTLEGWVQRGGQAVYEATGGMIVGTTRIGEPNSFLCTTRDYADFELKLDFKVDAELNSGIQIRSLSDPEYKDGRVHGYQVEIDPSARSWSGGIYDEARRGWLFKPKDMPEAQAAFKPGEWNHLLIRACGAKLQTWLNGVPVADLEDDMTATGFIALQVHSTKIETPLQVCWKEIWLRELEHCGSDSLPENEKQ